MAYPDGTVATTDEVHPTPIYETLSVGLIALALWQLRGRLAPGAVFAIYLVAVGLERLLVEFIRRNDALALGLTLPQLVSVALVAAGAAWLVQRRGRLVETRQEG
jgi:phosphatidylglycerol:prolipoprotein diacylglycerol transferase